MVHYSTYIRDRSLRAALLNMNFFFLFSFPLEGSPDPLSPFFPIDQQLALSTHETTVLYVRSNHQLN